MAEKKVLKDGYLFTSTDLKDLKWQHSPRLPSDSNPEHKPVLGRTFVKFLLEVGGAVFLAHSQGQGETAEGDSEANLRY